METKHATTTTSNAIPTPEIEMGAKAAAEGTVESAASLKQEIVALKIDYSKATDGTGLIQWDPWLEPYAPVLRRRYASFQAKKREIEGVEGSLYNFAGGYKKFGFNRTKNSIVYREWAPAAKAAYLIGDFNEWKIGAHPMTKDNFGVFSIELPDIDGKPQIPHNSKVKISLVSQNNERMDRIPAWIKYAVQPKGEISFVGVYWEPEEKFVPKHTRPPRPVDLRIYEAHVGMSSSEPKIATYKEFERDMLPYIKDLGYNAIQLMAIMEHVYYASFGYHVTNFFACSSRFGTPEDLKSLIDTAHGLGLVVLIDVVHSHASKNVLDGLNHFDGTDHQYFHGGGRGYHDLWDSRLFNYNHWEVSRFLLSNLRWWVEEYGFDGFRFDGVTSMLYFHHGMGKAFGSYDDYFGGDVDEEAVVYLMLANDMLHNAFPFVISIAEDVSGMPGLGRPVAEGGIGFDYRLAMAIPDKWIEILKKYKDEDWNMGNIVHTLVNRRYKEAAIAYAESHDQALVGDKTIAFWLMDKEMYDFMSVLSPLTPIIERGIALHKMIRLITFGLGGEGYLNFMGNESGHPEWIDFPREGNNNSFHHCRRRWDVLRDPLLRYKFLTMFDKRMMALEDKYKWLVSNHQYVSNQNEADKVIVFERGPLVFAFNFHPTKSFADYRIGVPTKDTYRVVLNSDNADFGGHSRIDEMVHYTPEDYPHAGRPYSMMVYIPNRTAVVYGPLDPQDAIEGPRL